MAVSWNSWSSVSLVHHHPIPTPCAVSNNGHVDYIYLHSSCRAWSHLISKLKYSHLVNASTTYAIQTIDWQVSKCSLHSVSVEFISTEVQHLHSNKTHRLLGIPLSHSRAATDSFTEAIGEVVIVGCLVESCEMDRLKKGWVQPYHSMQRTMVNNQSLVGSWVTCQHQMESNSKKYSTNWNM